MSEAERYPDVPEDIEELKKFAAAQYEAAERWKTEAEQWKVEAEHQQKHYAHISEQYEQTCQAYQQTYRQYEQTKAEYQQTYRQYEETKAEYEKTLQDYRALEEKYRILRHTLFGRSSEKWTLDEQKQRQLFNEAEACAEVPQEEATEEVHYRRSKPKGKRQPIPEEIPREEIVHDIPEGEKNCGCGAELQRIGEETSEKLEVIPAKVKVIRHVRPKYACTVCEGAGDEEQPAVRIAPAPQQLIPKSIASAGLISYIVTGKYEDALPLHRQEKIFRRIGVDIPRASMARWLITLAERVSPLLQEMDRRILNSQIIQMDETRIQVHDEPGKKDSAQSYMWVARGGPPERPLTRYLYHRSRSGEVARSYLHGFRGYLQSDAYGPYNEIGEWEGVVHVGCLAHARRKFDEADKATPKGSGAAKEILSLIRKIYGVEKELRANDELAAEEFLRLRREKAEPLFVRLQSKLEKKREQVPPSSALGKAVLYALEVLPKVRRYLDVHHLTPDNNAVERAIRPFVVGRKNWQFADTPSGAHASAAFYSLIESAKGASLSPYWYIRYVLQKLPEVEETDEWESLLPEHFSTDDLMIPSYF